MSEHAKDRIIPNFRLTDSVLQNSIDWLTLQIIASASGSEQKMAPVRPMPRAKGGIVKQEPRRSIAPHALRDLDTAGELGQLIGFRHGIARYR